MNLETRNYPDLVPVRGKEINPATIAGMGAPGYIELGANRLFIPIQEVSEHVDVYPCSRHYVSGPSWITVIILLILVYAFSYSMGVKKGFTSTAPSPSPNPPSVVANPQNP